MSQLRSYISGLLLSSALTLAAYFPVLKHITTNHHTLSHGTILLIILPLAVLQLIVQLFFFLHMGKSRWNFSTFIPTIILILILVVGSLWIMNHLNHNMTPDDMKAYMLQTEGVGK